MYDWLEKEVAAASDETLFEWMSNALATTCCIGHTKGHENETRASFYRRKLIERGHDVPVIDFWKTIETPSGFSYRSLMISKGKYGGAGSY